MARLPNPGGDNGQWGAILNEYLLESHTASGTLKSSAVDASAISDGSITTSKLGTSASPTSGQVLSYNGTALTWTTVSGSGSVPDADASTKGLIQLTGALGGTASNPTVPGLAGKENTITAGTNTQYYRGDKTWQTLNAATIGLGNVNNTSDAAKPISTATQTALDGKASTASVAAKADTSAVVALTGNQTITGTKNFTGTLQSGGQAVVATNDARLTDQRTPSDNSVVAAKIANDAVTEPKLSATNTPTNGQLLSFNGSNFTWVAAPTGGSDPVLGGVLSGNASNAAYVAGSVAAAALGSNAVTTVKILDSNVTTVKLADNAVTTVKITDANVTGAKIADNTITEPKLAVSNTPSSSQVLSWNGSALAWATPSGGGGNGARSVTTVRTAAYTAAAGEYVIVNPTAGGFNVTLPASPANGTWVTVKNIGSNSNAVLLVPGAGATIEDNGNYSGASISVNAPQMAVDVIYDGVSRWYRVG